MNQKDALDIMKMGYNVFLTGEAGTGKTHVVSQYISYLRKKKVSIAITASTGIAATHIDGVTIDSWSGLGIRDSVDSSDLSALTHKYHLVKRIQNAKILLTDEISMIAGKRFDAVDTILRYIRNNQLPFGGLQVILSGDLFQLPPVSKDRNSIDFIFKSRVWKELDFRVLYLDTPMRQSDERLLRILREIRRSEIDETTYELLSQRIEDSRNISTQHTKLYTHNVDVDEINTQELSKLPSEERSFFMSSLGHETVIENMKRTCLAPEHLILKKDALVMFVRNNYEKGYVNGSIGRVVGFDRNGDPEVKLLTGAKVSVAPASWAIMEDTKIVAQITQIPLRLAWAITVHKSQGMTLDAAEIDLSKSFVPGMGYVALSRVRSLSGVYLLGMNTMALTVNPEILAIDEDLRNLSEELSKNLKKLGLLKRVMKQRKFMYTLTS